MDEFYCCENCHSKKLRDGMLVAFFENPNTSDHVKRCITDYFDEIERKFRLGLGPAPATYPCTRRR